MSFYINDTEQFTEELLMSVWNLLYYLGVEKKNDDCRRTHLFKSNKWDAAKDVLLASKRLEILEHLERKPREYSKRNADYWESTIKEKRTALRESLKTPPNHDQEQDQLQPDNAMEMSPAQMRTRLKDMGHPTRARNLKRLRELYQLAIEEASKSQWKNIVKYMYVYLPKNTIDRSRVV